MERNGAVGARRSASRLVAALVVFASAIVVSTAFAGPDPFQPQISGEPVEGATLTATIGVEPDSYSWQRCTAAADVCDPPPVPRGGPPVWADIPGAQGPGADTYVLQAADVGNFVRVVADHGLCTRGGCGQQPSDPVGPIRPRAQVPAPAGGLPPPVARASANLEPLQGTILVKLPGTDSFLLLAQAAQVPLGSVIDARNGHVRVITARNDAGDLQSGEFWAGVFKLTQVGEPLVTRFELVGLGEPAGRARGRRDGRRLWGRGRCRCRTVGRHSSASVRGTWWLTAEKPRGTLTKVKRGRVTVRDFERNRKIRLKAGERYVARAGGGGV